MAGGNYDRSNKKSQLNPAVAYAFALQVEAAFFLPLRAVRVFTKENEFDYYQEGGLNDYVHLLRKPISKPFTFQVERYIGVDGGFLDLNSGFVDPLSLGTELILPVILYVNRSPAGDWYKNISFTNCARAYIFTGCTVISKEYGELNAEQSKLHTETVTIAYRELFAINQISPDWESGGQWEYDGTVVGDGTSHTENRNVNVAEEMKKWNFPGARPDGKEETTPSTDHRLVRSNKTVTVTTKKPSKWNFPGARLDGAAETTPSTDHTLNRSENTRVGMSKWNYPGTSEETKSVDHTLNRSVNEKADASKWNFPGASDKTASVDHVTNRNVNVKAEPSKWNFPGAEDGTASVDHTINRSINEKAEPSKWNFPGAGDETASVDHTANRSMNDQKAEPSKWSFPGAEDGMASVDHTTNRNVNEKAEPSKWSFPGAEDGTASVDHTTNRNINEKAEPSKWSFPGAEDGTASVDHTTN
ncbi:MAG: hypothetical protein IKQ49_07160, partial [Eubacterium sp.]|nr:hypothetical protein [Eubacterium sp.]